MLYSENRFIVIDGPSNYPVGPWPPGDYPHKSFAASQFLRDVVPRHCLGHLRFLEIVFAPFNHLNKPRDGHPALVDWLETWELAKHNLNLPVLTLRLIVATCAHSGHQGFGEMTRAQGKEVLAVYNSIVHPLRRLGPTSDGGLARFYAELAWPWRWTTWVSVKLEAMSNQEAYDWLASKDRELKRRTEQFVMEERYERVCVAAREPQASAWTWTCRNLEAWGSYSMFQERYLPTEPEMQRGSPEICTYLLYFCTFPGY